MLLVAEASGHYGHLRKGPPTRMANNFLVIRATCTKKVIEGKLLLIKI